MKGGRSYRPTYVDKQDSWFLLEEKHHFPGSLRGSPKRSDIFFTASMSAGDSLFVESHINEKLGQRVVRGYAPR
jgi:hypothetical protein